MGITEATSKSQLSRAKQKVKRLLTQEHTRSNR
jgi:DNA-directed RNA polymerase specialized sigma24 family protein